MSFGGTLIIENFNYGVSDAELPLFENDVPMLDPETGEQKTMQCKILNIEPVTGVRLEIRVAESEWDKFVAELGKKPITSLVADLEDLARLTAN